MACRAYVFQWGYDGRLPSIVSLGTISRLSGNSWKMTGTLLAFYLLLVSGPVSLLEVDVGSVPGGDEVTVFCNPIRIGRWSQLMVVCVCRSDEVRTCRKTASRPEHVQKLRSDLGMSLNFVPTRVCRKTASWPVHVLKLRPD